MSALLLILVLIPTAGGCLEGWRGLAPTQPQGADPPFADVSSDHGMLSESVRPHQLRTPAGTTVVRIVFDVLRIDIPVMGIRHSLKVWNHVDETQLDARRTALLVRNGVRIGVAPADAWPALRVLFEANQARTVRGRHPVQSGFPLSMRLGEVGDDETLFEYEPDGHLVGRTFRGGTRYLHIDYALDPGDPARTIIRMTPEVRKFSAGKRWQKVAGRLREVPRYEGKAFTALGADISVGPGEFLVIGPSETADLSTLIGGRFLTATENNVMYETVICVTPQPQRLEPTVR